MEEFKDLLAGDSRLILNTYSSNIVRIAELVRLAEESGRKVALLHRDIRHTIRVASQLGYVKYKEDTFIDIYDVPKYKDSELLILMAAPENKALKYLEQVAFAKSVEFSVKAGDVVVNSADLPPGTVRIMAQISDQFFLKDVKIMGGKNQGLDVEHYALQEEMKFLFNVVRSKYFVPMIGESRHLLRHAKLAVDTGFDPGSIFILDNGNILEFEEDTVKVIGSMQLDEVLFSVRDSLEISEDVIKERDQMSREGVVVVSFALNKKKKMVSGPVFSTRACTFSKNKEWRAFCMFNAQGIVDAINSLFDSNPDATMQECEQVVKSFMDKLVKQQIGKRPMLFVHGTQV